MLFSFQFITYNVLFTIKGHKMRIGILGLNHKLAGLELRERFAKACSRRFSADSSIHGERFFVLLSTCNRTEIYFHSEDLPKSHSYLLNILRAELEEDFEQKLYSFFGGDCFYHLSKVTAGLDSAIIGETEIQGQVKNSYISTAKFIKLPYELHYLFQKALHIGKQARHLLPPAPGLPNLEDAVYTSGKILFKNPEKSKILFVGASQINKKIITSFKSRQLKNITICNRSLEGAEKIAKYYQIETLAWEQLTNWPAFDWIIVGTKAQNYLLDDTHPLIRPKQKQLIIDLSIPRNVNPAIGKIPGCMLKNLEELHSMIKNKRQQFHNALSETEKAIVEAAKMQVTLFRERKPMILDQLQQLVH